MEKTNSVTISVLGKHISLRKKTSGEDGEHHYNATIHGADVIIKDENGRDYTTGKALSFSVCLDKKTYDILQKYTTECKKPEKELRISGNLEINVQNF